MIILLYIVLIYILLGSLVYLSSRYFIDKEISHFTQVLFWTLGFIFAPVIKTIMFIDFYSGINKFDKSISKSLKNNNVSKEDVAEWINNGNYTDEERKRLLEYNDKLYK